MLNILVTGADGQLGQSLRRLCAASPNNYIYTDIAELDITDGAAVRDFAAKNRVDVIVNCAAYNNVERAEEDAAAAEMVNITAARNLAEAALAEGATLIHFSSDYVFDGQAHRPYKEEDAATPQSVYGRSKLASEKAVAESGCKYLIFRTAWLYSEFGHNFLKAMLHLMSERENLNVVYDQIGTPTYAGDLAMTIMAIIDGEYYRGNEGVYNFSNEGVASWYDFTVAIAAAVGNDRCHINPCRTEEYPTRAVRPHYSVLDKAKIKRTFGLEIPHWQESMRYCLYRLLNSQNREQ